MNTEKIEKKLEAQLDIMSMKLAELFQHRRNFQKFLQSLDPDKLDSNFVEGFKQELDKYEQTLADMPLDDLCGVYIDLEAKERYPTCPECGKYKTYQADVDDFRKHKCGCGS